VIVCCDWFVRVALRSRENCHSALYGNLSPIYGAESTNQRDTDTPSPVFHSNMDPVHIPVPNSCNCDVVPNEKANTASTLIASRYPIIINDIGLFARIFFYKTALVRISSHTHRQTRICAHYTLSNSQMCISVIETKRSPIHGLVPLCIVAMTKFRPDYPQIMSPQIPWAVVELGLRDIYARKRPRSWVIRKNLGYGWIGQQPGSGFINRPPATLGVFASLDRF
jgi:hypothetical protein